jgi:hypothetical protein
VSGHHDGAVRSVTVEFLRPGPPHNQLLSPLTRYLAVCGDGRVGEVSVPYEHSEFVRRLRDLRYIAALPPDFDDPERERERQENLNAGNVDRQAALIELSKHMSQFLAAVPGLTAQLAQRQCASELVHLQIMITAAELAMLPFELAGTLEQPGSDPGSFLQLGAKPLISITRRSRGLREDCVHWPTRPKILFVAANPTQPIPYEAHVDARLRALQPWLPPLQIPSSDDAARARAYDRSFAEHLVVLKQASISAIAEHCARGNFTHVHVLAHGATDLTSPGQHFGLALHSDHDKSRVHVVSGAQFASALRRDGGELGPTVVTLAACDSGNVQEVMYTGASFAHELHRSGIPFVVASQFPLSVAGSSILTQQFYANALLGKDPRAFMCDVRLRLHSVYAGVAHDWASLVTYAVLPPNLNEQLEDTRYHRARRALNVALDSLDIELTAHAAGQGSTLPAVQMRAMKESLFTCLDDAMRLIPTTGRYAREGLGLLAAAEKRRAEFCLVMSEGGMTRDPEQRSEATERLRLAMDTYEKAFVDGVRSNERAADTGQLNWAITQHLTLAAVLDGTFSDERLATASVLSQAELHGRTPYWARTSLLELAILRWWIKGQNQSAELEEEADELIALTQDDKFVLHSTERQLRRYLDWWWHPDFAKKPVPAELRAKVAEIADRFAAEHRRGPYAARGAK